MIAKSDRRLARLALMVPVILAAVLAVAVKASAAPASAPGLFPLPADCYTHDYVIFFYGGRGHMHGHATAAISITCTEDPESFTATMALYAHVKAGQKGPWLRVSRYLTLDLNDLPTAGNTDRYHLHGVCWKQSRIRMVLTYEGVGANGEPDHGTYYYPNRYGHKTRVCDKGD